MGLFDKLLGKKGEKEIAERTTDNKSHQQEWDFYFSHVDDIIGSFYIDLSLSKIGPVNGKPNLLWISVQMRSPRKDGLSSSEEFETLKEIDDRLQEYILSKHEAIYVGRLTTDGRRDFYYYMGDTLLHDKSISESMTAFPMYSFDFGIKKDEKWDQYFNFMCPDPKQFQSIQNRKVIYQLEKNGDKLDKSRPVDHWIYFKTQDDRTLFLTRIEHLNFTVISMDKNSSGDQPYSLHISRVDHVDYNRVDDHTLVLWELAQECNGEYDGWETSIERS